MNYLGLLKKVLQKNCPRKEARRAKIKDRTEEPLRSHPNDTPQAMLLKKLAVETTSITTTPSPEQHTKHIDKLRGTKTNTI